ncbi:glycoside hydrolase superfamily [Sphaerosporella brunnea]|uniref:Glycoside hydrolase superfamily n=1 Tax=Sphaerosporella brunnea TaxID=1250544 RepID=A0A5J5EHS6_9PEZI|nr:glycoside hydrolase superfamily [Sphaerosporella brunnea]
MMFSSASRTLVLALLTLGASASRGGTPTVSYNVSAAETYLPNKDYSNEQLALLWYQVGPVATHPVVTATVEPTPEPSWAGPGEFHPFVASNYPEELAVAKLPPGFNWGMTSSAYQLEGAAKDEGRGPSIWDLLSHRNPNQVADNSTGDVLAQHYYLYKQDFQRLAKYGSPYYSTSISWPRIFPFGKGPINEAGIKHYDDVIAELVKHGIKPALSLFHWDTPLALFNEYGGWTNPKIVDDYLNYAKFVIARYDKHVPVWFTFNEPQYCNWQYSYYPAGILYPSYGIGPGINARFICGHYTLLAHAKLAKWYHNEFKGKGRISFKNSGNYYQPVTNSTGDLEAAKRATDFSIGWFGGPWTDGDYPQSLKDTLGEILPTLSKAEKALIKGSCDFYALDGYTAFYVSELPGGANACARNRSDPNYPECGSSSQVAPNGFSIGPAADAGASWLKSTPTGIRKFLSAITKEIFPAVKDIVVSEFGFAEPFESEYASVPDAIWDLRRTDYIQGFLDNILLAITEDHVNVTGAYIWSIMDNFEWGSGIKTRFGMQYVSYDTLTRTPKASWFQARNWFKRHGGEFLPGAE